MYKDSKQVFYSGRLQTRCLKTLSTSIIFCSAAILAVVVVIFNESRLLLAGVLPARIPTYSETVVCEYYYNNELYI